MVAARHDLAVATSWNRLLHLIHERPVAAVVVDDLISCRAGGLASAVRHLKAHYPSVACVVVARSGSDPHALVRLGRARVENLVLVPEDLLEDGLRRELNRALRFTTISLVARAVTPYVPPREASVLRRAVDCAALGSGAEDLASYVGLTRPHLSERLKSVGLPSTGHLLVWGRLLHAGRWLPDPGRSAESVARQLEYSSGAAFRRALKNYVGATPTEVIAAGGFSYILDKFFSACSVDRTRHGAGRSAA